MRLEHRVAKVSGVNALSTALAVGAQVVSVPVCLHFWGRETYGAWLALMAAAVLMRTFDGGYINFVGNKINLLYHTDRHELRRTLASAAWGIAALGTAQVGALVMLYWVDALNYIIDPGVRVASSDTALALAIISGSWILSGAYIGIVHRLLIPAGYLYQSAWWSLVFQGSQFVAIIIAAVTRCHLLTAATFLAGVQLVVYLASAFYIKSKLPEYFPWWKSADGRRGLQDVIGSLPLTAAGVMQQGSNSGMVLLVSAAAGTSLVPVFVTARTLANLWTTAVGVFTTPLLPDVVRYYARKEGAKLLAVHEVHWLVIGTAVNLSVLAIYPFLHRFYLFWTRGNLPFDSSLISMLLISVSIAAMGSLLNVSLSGINDRKYILIGASLRGAIAVVGCALLLPRLGLAGAGIAVAAGEAAFLVLSVAWMFRRCLQGDLSVRPRFSAIVWLGLSSALVVGYLCAAAFYSAGTIFYWCAVTGVIVAAFAAYQSLDREVQLRMRSLTRLSALVPSEASVTL